MPLLCLPSELKGPSPGELPFTLQYMIEGDVFIFRLHSDKKSSLDLLCKLLGYVYKSTYETGLT